MSNADLVYYLRKKKREAERLRKAQGREVTANDPSLVFNDAPKKKLRRVLEWNDGTWGL